MPYLASENEKEILKFWDKNKTFEKSVKERPENKPYVFYDGPPFATGLPHYGHIVASLMKDVVPRYWTMQGYRVERVWGWDCHGLPVENIIEKDLGLNSKKEIEELGIKKFNDACCSAVLKYTGEWRQTVERMGRWVDMEHAYKTMDIEYMESVWWVFSELWKKGLIYEGYKAMHICPRCVTPLSNFEVTQNYKDVKDLSVVVKFKLTNAKEKLGIEGNVYALAWTTTPWTLPGNVALAVGEDIDYVIVRTIDVNKRAKDGTIQYDNLIIARDIFNGLYDKDPKDALKLAFNIGYARRMNEGEEVIKAPQILKEVKGSKLVGLEYEPIFEYENDLNEPVNAQPVRNGWKIYEANFVNTEEGTGIVHIAPAFGEDDMNLYKEKQIPFIQHIGMDGVISNENNIFRGEAEKFVGRSVVPRAKGKENEVREIDIDIKNYLEDRGLLFTSDKYLHSYPHCWRCDTALLNYATHSWFVDVDKIKDKLLGNNKKITWVPEHMKEGRFGKWLEGARDWAISRNRFWGTPLPIWRCEANSSETVANSKCGNTVVVGSVEELQKLSGEKIKDLHKHVIDEITFKCDKCGGEMRRIPEVLDCWFESGSMPYGQMHYPFENKAKFEAGFPAEFIAEGQDQTRGWFYTLHVLAAALTQGENPSIPVKESKPAFKNVIVNGIVLAEDGKKMSKRLKNYPDPNEILEKYGADAMRYYLVSSPVMHAENLNFSEDGVRDVYNRVVNTLWNVFTFYQMFANELRVTDYGLRVTNNVLDRWIMAKLQLLVKEVTENMNAYKLAEASRPIMDFVLELSQWYVRRSRDRFKGDDEEDKQAALATLREVLLTLSKVMAPFTPFIAESIYREIRDKKDEISSVHLEMWPAVDEKIDEEILNQMDRARKLVETGLSLRKEAGIKVRQPLSRFQIPDYRFSGDLLTIIADELNVKKVEVGKEIEVDTELTDELKKEGMAREIVRAINQIRKEKGLTRENQVKVIYETDDEELKKVFAEFEDDIKKQVLADKIKEGGGETEVEINEKKMKLKVE